GQKLQNHALNARLNDEFRKFYPTVDKEPIIRDVSSQRYWIQESLLSVEIRGRDGKKHQFNLAKSVIKIIDAYVATKKEAFESFIETCKEIASLAEKDVSAIAGFVKSQLQPSVDARIFEIISYGVLKTYYGEKIIFWGWSKNNLTREPL